LKFINESETFDRAKARYAAHLSRLENARHMPTFEMVARYAAAIGRRLDSRLAPSASETNASQAWR
jgi:hypothetical protein